MLAATASTLVAPRDTSIDRELRAHFASGFAVYDPAEIDAHWLLGNFRGPALLNLRPSDSPGEITEGLRQAVGNNCVPIFLSSY